MTIVSKPPNQRYDSGWDRIFGRRTGINIYLAGPMRGIKDFNFPAFYKASQTLRNSGNVVFNPAERDVEEHGEEISKSPTGDLKDAEKKGFNLRTALAADLEWICLRAEAICLLPGWENSKGACAERATALALGLEIIHYVD